MTVCHRGFECG